MNFKRSKRTMAIMLAMVMLFSMLLPVGSAFASSSDLRVLSTPVVTEGENKALGTVRVTVPAGSINGGDVATLKLPSGFKFSRVVTNAVYDSATNNDNYLYVPEHLPNTDNRDNSLYTAGLELTRVSSTELRIEASNDQDLATDGMFYIVMRDIEVDRGTNDAILTISGPSNSGFPMGEVLVGKSTRDGEVKLTTRSTDTSENAFTFTLRIAEDVAGSMTTDQDALKLRLPKGYEWRGNAGDNVTPAATLWEQARTFNITQDGDTLEIGINDVTTSASAWELELNFFVDDEDDVKLGDIFARVSGKTDADVDEIKVGTYGQYELEIEIDEVEQVLAGKVEQELGTITIKEGLGSTLVQDRYVYFKLSDNAKWQPIFEDEDSTTAPEDRIRNLEGADLEFMRYTGSEGRIAQYRVSGDSGDDADEIEIEGLEIATRANATGDVTLEIYGSAGLQAELVVAKLVNTITAEVDQVASVVLGAANQSAGTVTFTEAVEEALEKDGIVRMELPQGVYFTNVPKVRVVDGDARIGSVTLSEINGEDRVAEFRVQSDSTEPASFEVSDINLNVYRHVPQGNIELKIGGDALVETANDAQEDWANFDYAAKIAIATVVNPAESSSIVFNVGSTIYTANGVSKIMDAAPYIKNDRTYVPVRFVAEALGAQVDYESGEVTIVKGNTTLKLTIGSTALDNNGNITTMDVAPEIANDRTMLPARFVAEGLGAEVGYHAGQIVIIQ